MTKVRRWNHGYCTPFEVPGVDLRAELAAMFPDDEVRIRGDGYEPISTASHCAAAGYPPPESEEAGAYPAHFNRPFFEILHQVQEAK